VSGIVSPAGVPVQPPLCAACRQHLGILEREVAITIAGETLKLCAVCNSLHQPLLVAIRRALTPQRAGLEI
jgi:hypothetical protein